MARKKSDVAVLVMGTAKTASGKNSVAREIDPQNALVPNSQKTVKQAVSDYVEANKVYKDAEKIAKSAGEDVKTFIKQHRDTNAEQGDYQKTYRVLGNKDGDTLFAADVSQIDKWTIPKSDIEIDAIKDLVGDDFFAKMLSKEVTISIRKEVMDNKVLRAELTAKLVSTFGKDLNKYFVKEEVWETADGLAELQYKLDKDKRDKMRGVLKPSSDAIKDASYTV